MLLPQTRKVFYGQLNHKPLAVCLLLDKMVRDTRQMKSDPFKPEISIPVRGLISSALLQTIS